MEDKRVCPRCGHVLHERPYLLSRGAHLVRGWQWMARTLMFVWLLAAFALV